MSPVAVVAGLVVTTISLPFLALLLCAATPLVETAADEVRPKGE
jgi:hypothetical protein